MLNLVSSKPYFHLAFWHQAGFFIDKKRPNLWHKELLAIAEPKQERSPEWPHLTVEQIEWLWKLYQAKEKKKQPC